MFKFAAHAHFIRPYAFRSVWDLECELRADTARRILGEPRTMEWLSKLLNFVMWPARAALTVVYASRPFKFIFGALITVRGFAAVVQGDTGSIDHQTAQGSEVAQITPSEAVIPAEIESSAGDNAGEQLSTWAWGMCRGRGLMLGEFSAVVFIFMLATSPYKTE